MKFVPLPVTGAFLVEIERREDARGYFARLYCEKELESAGLVSRFVQFNTGFSPRRGTLRGLHYQKSPHDEVKLVRCVRGAVFDVLVDMRPESPTYRHWYGTQLDPDNGRMLYVPARCAHGYMTLLPDTELTYFASVPYAPESATGVRYDDPAFGIAWPEPIELVSDADKSWPLQAPR
jgi:dTDP-4-dehydrorhamnose 3,5-epimerase